MPDGHFSELRELFVEPFLEARKNLEIEKPMLLTVIAKEVQLSSIRERDELLTWSTSFGEIDGVYLIFDNNFTSKQIKDPAYLVACLRFIRALRRNGIEVHIGYSGLEGLLYSLADPTSVSVGSYENLRSFAISRLEVAENGGQTGPRARVYSSHLCQWLVDTALPPLRELYSDFENLFSDSPYKDFLLDPTTKLNFQRAELYKHYFVGFADIVNNLPEKPVARFQHLKDYVTHALGLFGEIEGSGVILDQDSDGSHLTGWLNAINMFEANPE